ncbi:MAG: hypothetical protein ACTSU7_05940 [Candidatus Heimdallarchaeaceae archaeon]
MKLKTIMGSTLLGFTLILLTMSSTVTQANLSSQNFSSTLDVDPIFIEEMQIIAGKDSAALVELILLGESAPTIASNSLFSDVENWLFIASDQADYLPYLDRRPFRAADNATLILEIDGSLGADGSLAKAVQISILFATYYDVGLFWSGADKLPNNNYLYYFTGGMENTIFNTLITEIKTDVGTGFASLLDPATVSGAPVKAVVIGEGFIEGRMLPVRGIFYVDDAAITGTTTFTLSTDTLFGTNVVAKTGLGIYYSTLKFKFPYTINPLEIYPKTDNFAPQITGKMDWLLNAPWQIAKPAQDYYVVFDINHDELTSAPRVSVNMAYDQDMLNNDGRLQMDYVVTNTGTENATDIDISYPLGPDFLTFIASTPDLPVLRSDVYVDESVVIKINATIDMDVSGVLETFVADMHIEQTGLVLEGWYRWVSDDTLVDFDPLLTSTVVKSDTTWVDAGAGVAGSVTTTISLSSPDGLPGILVSNAIALLAPIDITDYVPYSLSTVGEIFADYETNLWAAVEATGHDLYDLLYTEIPTFVPDLMDFSFSARSVGVIGNTYHEEVFLNTTIPFLAVGDSVNVSWALDNIPAKDDIFGIMGIEVIDNGIDPAPAVHLTTVEKDGYDLMQLLFGIFDPGATFTYSRPLSFYSIWENDWISVGARYSYLDEQEFEYFGFSNGINLQIADDEAVLNVHVSLDQTGYTVGDPVTVTYSVENTGNLAAENVKIYLFHGRIGSDWQIRDAVMFWYDEVGTVVAGGYYEDTADVLANSFLGIYPVYAVAEFDTDVGQSAEVVDFGNGLTATFEGAAETHHKVLSNMDWAMLLPDTTNREPAFPQPILSIDVSVLFIIPEDAPWELEITITITNVGDETTHLTIYQVYNATSMELKNKESTLGSIANNTAYGLGIIVFMGITLAPGESVEITMRWLFLTSSGCFIPGIRIVYDSRFESGVGDGLGEGTPEAAVMSAMNGEAQDSEDWEDYGESTSTGSSAGADVFTGGDNTRRTGSFDALYWSLGAIFVTATVSTMLRRKLKH